MMRTIQDWLLAGAIAVAVAIFCHFFLFESYVVDGDSMEPSLSFGQHILVEKITYPYGTPHRGDIVVFRYPRNPSRAFVKRVIGLPGDRVEVTGGHVIVNGFLLNEPYAAGETEGIYPSTIIPEGRLFVLGDNREVSEDSRSSLVGLVPMENIEGKVFLRIYPFYAISRLDKQKPHFQREVIRP